MQKSVLLQPNNGQAEIEITEEIMKRTERFLRKVAPLVEKELDENLPLYGRTAYWMQDWEAIQVSKPSSATLGLSIPYRTRTQARISCR